MKVSDDQVKRYFSNIKFSINIEPIYFNSVNELKQFCDDSLVFYDRDINSDWFNYSIHFYETLRAALNMEYESVGDVDLKLRELRKQIIFDPGDQITKNLVFHKNSLIVQIFTAHPMSQMSAQGVFDFILNKTLDKQRLSSRDYLQGFNIASVFELSPVSQTISNAEEILEMLKYTLFEAEEKKNSLESLYSKKLALKNPTEEWKKYANESGAKAQSWRRGVFICTFLIVLASTMFLLFIPSIYPNDTTLSQVIQRSLLVGLGFGSLVSLLRICMKMMYSNYHIQQDALERKQLTSFYLSLMESEAISDKHKELVFESLFSRAESGILKGDASPVLPGSLSNLIQLLGKSN